MDNSKSDGSTASYYELPIGASQLQDLISHRNMNAQIGEIFRSCYRFGMASHSDQLRDARKIEFYIKAEIARLQKNSEEPIEKKEGTPRINKCIEIAGKTFLVRSWAKWVAQDEDGTWYTYQYKPVLCKGNSEYVQEEGWISELYKGEPNDKFYKTLQRI